MSTPDGALPALRIRYRRRSRLERGTHGRYRPQDGLPQPADMDLVCASTANVLLVGVSSECDRVVGLMRPNLLAPVREWTGSEPASTRSGDAPATLIVRGAERLAAADQQDLFAWLSDPGAPRVITLSVEPLYPLIERGTFSAALYYRLNTIHIPLGPQDAFREGGSGR